MQRSTIPNFFFALAAAISISAGSFYFLRPGVPTKPKPTVSRAPVVEKAPSPPEISGLADPMPAEDPETVLADLGVGVSVADPEVLVSQIASALEAGTAADEI